MFDRVSIVGMACRFPGAANPTSFWSFLKAGGDAVRPIPSGRVQLSPTLSQLGRGGFLENIELFDNKFFDISRREACAIDPQHRLLLTVSWEAIESAGHNPLSYRGSRCGVFIGQTAYDYALITDKSTSNITAHTGLGNAKSLAANRISHFLGLRGPSMTIDAACASSLVAVHLASQSLQLNECDVAIVGGVNLILCPSASISFAKAKMLAKDGRCKSFDNSADGYVRSEGCGILVLKRELDALRDGDEVLASILGTAVNHNGGSTRVIVPDQKSQIDVIRTALRKAEVCPHDVDFVEAHGTGTSMGDPIELNAILDVFGSTKRRLLVGSVKTNIGHLEAAAGVASLIKTIFCLRHGLIPRNLHFSSLNANVLDSTNRLLIPTDTVSWPEYKEVRIAGVSSFGFGGTNCHIVLKNCDTSVAPATTETDEALLTLSAKTPTALARLANRYVQFLMEDDSLPLGDVCYTANTGRAPFEHRLAILARERSELVDALIRFAQGESGSRFIDCGLCTNRQVSSHDQQNGNGAERTLLELAKLFVHGAHIDWNRIKGGTGRRRFGLPTMPFEGNAAWITPTDPLLSGNESKSQLQESGTFAPAGRDLLDSQIGSSRVLLLLDDRLLPYVKQHRVGGLAIVPGVVLLEIVLAAAGNLDKQGAAFHDVSYVHPLKLTDGARFELEIVFKSVANDEKVFQVSSRDINDVTVDFELLASGRMVKS